MWVNLILWTIILLNKSVPAQRHKHILTPKELKLIRENDKFLYKYIPQVIKQIFPLHPAL